MKIAILSKFTKEDECKYGELVAQKALELGAEVVSVYDFESCDKFDKYKFVASDTTAILAGDIIVIVGGDGTIIHYAKLAAKYKKPILGVNVGTVGALATIEKNEIDKIEKLILKKYNITSRMMLDVKFDDKIVTALNDVVIHRDVFSPISKYTVNKNGKVICSYISDGIICSTSTGSTAYSLSAGGPMLEPTLDCVVVTPICAHSMFAKSIVLGAEKPLEIEYDITKSSNIALIVDGNVQTLNYENANNVEISRSLLEAQFITFPEDNFYSRVVSKLSAKI